MRFNISFIILKIHGYSSSPAYQRNDGPSPNTASRTGTTLYAAHPISRKQPETIRLLAASVLLCIHLTFGLCGLGFLVPFLPLLLIDKVAGDSYEYHSA